MSLDIVVVPDLNWPETVAERFVSAMRPGMRLCLATGATMTPFYDRVASRCDLEGVSILLLDEFGGLPRGDAGRCESMLRRDLLDRLRGPAEVHVPDVDDSDPDTAAERYKLLLRSGGLDLAIVGLGANGHVGMNEPGTGRDEETRVVKLDETTSVNALGYGASSPPGWGITVGIAELMTAAEVWVLVTGGHKRHILGRMLTEPVGSHLPATYLREHPRCTIFADESAGSDRQ